MKKYKFLILFNLLFLSACVSASDPQVNTILSMARPKSMGLLQGKTTHQVRNLVGEPTFIRKEAPNESWIFKAPDCALFIFFDNNGIATYTEKKGSCDKQVAKRLLAQRKTDA